MVIMFISPALDIFSSVFSLLLNLNQISKPLDQAIFNCEDLVTIIGNWMMRKIKYITGLCAAVPSVVWTASLARLLLHDAASCSVLRRLLRFAPRGLARNFIVSISELNSIPNYNTTPKNDLQ